MSIVFRFRPGETEKRSKVRFGFKSCFGRLRFANLCAKRSSGVQRVCQFQSASVWCGSKRIRDSPVSSNCRAVECAVLSAERDPLGTADDTAAPAPAYFGAARKFRVK